MQIQNSELGNGIRIIKLHGTFDALGTDSIEVDFVRCCAGQNMRILVDLSRVNYISSIGIPLLINSAKAVARRGGKMALFKPQKAVEEILELTGIPLIIPIYHDLKSATAGLCSDTNSLPVSGH